MVMALGGDTENADILVTGSVADGNTYSETIDYARRLKRLL